MATSASAAITLQLPREIALAVAEALDKRYEELRAYHGDNTPEEHAEEDRLGEALDALAREGVQP